MGNSQGAPKPVKHLVETIRQDMGALIARKHECAKELLKKILQEPRAQETFDKLTRKDRDRAFLESYLTEPVKPDDPVEDAESRKADRNLAKQLKGTLEKAQGLIDSFRRLSPEPSMILSDPLKNALECVKPWAEKRRFVPLFNTPRENQQFRLLEHIHRKTGKWHYREALTLLAAIYGVRNISEAAYPNEDSLKHLVKKFKNNGTAADRQRKAKVEKHISALRAKQITPRPTPYCAEQGCVRPSKVEVDGSMYCGDCAKIRLRDIRVFGKENS